ncbi:alcohol dehydrogenase [Ponticaulis profundi]|uniref:Alcohol dehydrogenase n=1 Tax=Ponticaulis profundi TaxID=2665222 RepID=A0ABW1S9L7_9PROT
MKSYKFEEFGAPLQRVEEPTPEPTGKQVLIRMASCGVCHSDIHIHDGYFDLGGGRKLPLDQTTKRPHTLGHEIVGEVVSTGPDVEGIEPGSKWLVYPWIGCGKCSLCVNGEEHLCPVGNVLGLSAPGGFSDHVMVPDSKYLVDYGNVPDAIACTYACSSLTAFSALKKAQRVTSEDPILIIGAGGVGQSAIALCTALYGVAPIVAEINEDRRADALKLGASEAVDPSDKASRKALLKSTGGGFATVIDFVGAPATAEFGMSVLRKGGKQIMVGLFGGSIEMPLATIPMRSITLSGSYVGSLEELKELAELGRAGKVPEITISTCSLDAADETLKALREGKITGRAVLQS